MLIINSKWSCFIRFEGRILHFEGCKWCRCTFWVIFVKEISILYYSVLKIKNKLLCQLCNIISCVLHKVCKSNMNTTTNPTEDKHTNFIAKEICVYFSLFIIIIIIIVLFEDMKCNLPVNGLPTKTHFYTTWALACNYLSHYFRLWNFLGFASVLIYFTGSSCLLS